MHPADSENSMLKRRIRTLAVTGIVTVAAALVTLTTTAASAAPATASAPAHVTAPSAAEASSGCVTEDFGTWDEPYYESCVRDAQILLNNLWSVGAVVGLYQLTVDGYYGPLTEGDVVNFQASTGFLAQDGILGPQTWEVLCGENAGEGFEGLYWHDAGCATEPVGNPY
jgi:hypothetical protein